MMFYIPGRIPSKKNSKTIVCRGSRPILLPSKQYQAWHEEQLWELKAVREKFEVAKIAVRFFFPDKRRKDLSNAFESIADLLVDAGILKDDSADHLPEIRLTFGGIDPKNPRAEITLDTP